MYICMYIFMYVCVYVCIYVCVYVCYVFMYVCMFIHLRTISTDILGAQCKIWTSINAECLVIEYTPSVLILGFTR